MIQKAIFIVACAIGCHVMIALGLILSQPPRELKPRESLDFSGIVSRSHPDTELLLRTSFTTSDGYAHPVTRTRPASEGLPLIIMVHGSGWHNAQFDGLALALRDVADVRAVTLRGHGETPQRRGDVRYIGQMEDDLAELIREAQGNTPDRKVILLGHSSGGGLVIRFAGGPHGDLIDSAVLLAPFLKHNAPTTRGQSGGWAVPLVRRLIGLSMLNMVRIPFLNHLDVIQFNMPKEILQGPQGKFATTAYSYRMNTSYAPRSDYLGDIAQLPPFLLVAGREDEAFLATAYEPTLSAVTDAGQYLLLDGVGHLDVVDVPETLDAIRNFLRN